MNSVYEIISVLKVDEICERYKLSRKDRVAMEDLFIRFDEIERFLETEDEQRILEVQADAAGDILKGNPHSRALCCAIAAICEELRLMMDAVCQLNDPQQEGALLH